LRQPLQIAQQGVQLSQPDAGHVQPFFAVSGEYRVQQFVGNLNTPRPANERGCVELGQDLANFISLNSG